VEVSSVLSFPLPNNGSEVKDLRKSRLVLFKEFGIQMIESLRMAVLAVSPGCCRSFVCADTG
jgi:hypothetical protein